MNIQIFGKSKCFDTKKAERYFKERGIRFQSINLSEKGMSLSLIHISMSSMEQLGRIVRPPIVMIGSFE